MTVVKNVAGGGFQVIWSCPLCGEDVVANVSASVAKKNDPAIAARLKPFCSACQPRLQDSCSAIEQAALAFLVRGTTRHQFFYGSAQSWMANLRDRVDVLDRALRVQRDEEYRRNCAAGNGWDKHPVKTLGRALSDLVSVSQAVRRNEIHGRGSPTLTTSPSDERRNILILAVEDWSSSILKRYDLPVEDPISATIVEQRDLWNTLCLTERPGRRAQRQAGRVFHCLVAIHLALS